VTIAAGTPLPLAGRPARETGRRNLGYNVYAVVCRRGLLLVLCCALVSVPSALAVVRPPVLWSPAGSGSNFTPALHRTIDRIVIHATEGGSLIGNVSWLAGDASESSAHYVVSRDGQIVQLVPLHDVAWHSGNRAVNEHSIGIEHIGETDDPAGFTAAEYRASAQLVAWLARRYRIPINRRHIIGHAEVPDPFHPGALGGSDHHTDPGTYWRWGYYLKLVRKFAFPLKVKTTTIEPGETLAGIVPWRVRTTGGTAARVEFLVDGRPVWSDARRPFAFGGGRGLNTTTLSNGTHVLTVRALGRDAHAAQRLVVGVANRAFALTSAGVRPWQKAKGVLRVRVRAHGARTTGVGLYVDGHVVSRDLTAPYTLRWDTRRVHDGLHRVSLVATSTDRRLAKRRVPVVVSNHVTKPRPKPKPKPRRSAPPQITAANVVDGQTVSGVVDWRAHTIGPVARVEFSVDGVVIARQTREPWATTWDASTAAPGQHTLEVDAYTRDGQKAASVATVTIAPTP
jgi:hypothetical protein